MTNSSIAQSGTIQAHNYTLRGPEAPFSIVTFPYLLTGPDETYKLPGSVEEQKSWPKFIQSIAGALALLGTEDAAPRAIVHHAKIQLDGVRISVLPNDIGRGFIDAVHKTACAEEPSSFNRDVELVVTEKTTLHGI